MVQCHKSLGRVTAISKIMSGNASVTIKTAQSLQETDRARPRRASGVSVTVWHMSPLHLGVHSSGRHWITKDKTSLPLERETTLILRCSPGAFTGCSAGSQEGLIEEAQMATVTEDTLRPEAQELTHSRIKATNLVWSQEDN